MVPWRCWVGVGLRARVSSQHRRPMQVFFALVARLRGCFGSASWRCVLGLVGLPMFLLLGQLQSLPSGWARACLLVHCVGPLVCGVSPIMCRIVATFRWGAQGSVCPPMSLRGSSYMPARGVAPSAIGRATCSRPAPTKRRCAEGSAAPRRLRGPQIGFLAAHTGRAGVCPPPGLVGHLRAPAFVNYSCGIVARLCSVRGRPASLSQAIRVSPQGRLSRESPPPSHISHGLRQ